MWLFTKIGFFSVVCARLAEGAGRPDPDRLMVRARSIQHLQALKATFPDVFVDPIHESERSDYPARLFVTKAAFAERVMPKLAEMIGYDNFKGELTRTGQHKYHDACSSVWGTMLRLQEPRRRASRQESLFDREDEPRWWETRRSKRERDPAPPSMPSPVREAPRPPVARTGDVVVVGRWADGGAIEHLIVLTDVAHYRRSRVAVRDAAARGWCDPIPRSRLSLERLTAADAARLYPGLKRVSMAGVLPSKGEPVVPAKPSPF